MLIYKYYKYYIVYNIILDSSSDYFFSCRLLVLVLQTRAITMEFANPQIALLLVLLANVLVVIQALRVRWETQFNFSFTLRFEKNGILLCFLEQKYNITSKNIILDNLLLVLAIFYWDQSIRP